MALADDIGLLATDGAAAREPVTRARHLPGYAYTSPRILAREKDVFFMSDWLCVGRGEELAEPGDYATLRAMGEPLVVARDRGGRLNAFANVCAHRGVEVAKGEGNAGEFSCPYHGWLYDLTGKLVGAPYMREAVGFDPGNCRLKPLRLEQWAGWIFVSFAPSPRPFAEFIAPFERAFAPIRQAELKIAYRFDIELDCNWKFIYENLLDTYHVGVLHAATIGAFYDTSGNRSDFEPDGAFTAEYRTRTQAPDGIPLFGPIPWLAERGEDFAMNGYLPPQHVAVRALRQRQQLHDLAADAGPLPGALLPPDRAFILRRSRVRRQDPGLSGLPAGRARGGPRHAGLAAAGDELARLCARADVEARKRHPPRHQPPPRPRGRPPAAPPGRARNTVGSRLMPRTKLRSQSWFNDPLDAGMTALYIERYMNFGLTREELQSGRPIVGIAQTGSDLSPCNRIHQVLVERMRAGIREAGGIPIEFPVHPIQESGRRPTAAIDRNLAYLGLVEILHGYPIDGVILTTGCDKTTPAMIMAAATANLPAISLNGGPMLNGWWEGRRAGSGTIVWEARRLRAAGDIAEDEFLAMVAASAPSPGHCNTMGTASHHELARRGARHVASGFGHPARAAQGARAVRL